MEDGSDSTNYWLQIVQPTDEGSLYINSLKDTASKTETKDGVIYTTREVMLDGYHDDVHNILVANVGAKSIEKLSVELKSDVVELDSYWTLSGKNNLGIFNVKNVTERNNSSGMYSDNIAKIALRVKDGVEDGTDITGTLTIKSGEKELVVMTLTGIIGDPVITTTKVPNAVKNVSYKTTIQNSNKYSWNNPTYKLSSGNLPEGMVINENGELYGVPKETGTFTFKVQMTNPSTRFDNIYNYREFTLIVDDNTDENVNNDSNSSNDSNNSNDSSNDSSSSSSSSSSSNSSSSVSSTTDASVKETVTSSDNGYIMSQVDVTENHVIKAELMNKYYGKNVLLSAVFSPEFAITIDMANVSAAVEDLDINYTSTTMPSFSTDFNTTYIKASSYKKLKFNPYLNFNVGMENIGKKAYIFALSSDGSSFELKKIMTTNEIGNVAILTDTISDIVIMIEK